ncbi:hypothetical protein [Vibrio profundi]|uniref:hypothetical protein n=1 Tax=Vibrio profundi TaxID=1774960 RepID=UPI003735A7A7
MKQLKLGVLLLFVGASILWLLDRFPLTSSTGNQVSATVISNTLTQSLDGHRRYLTLESDLKASFRLGIDPKIDCPVGSIVYLETIDSILSSQTSFRFIRCVTK